MTSAVVFDLDDTLAITERDRVSLLESAADRADVSLSFDRAEYLDAHREHSGTESRQPVFEALVGSDAAALTESYRNVVGDALVPVDGVEPLLDALQRRYPVGLLTDGPGETQRDKLRRLGWTDRFDAVVVTGPIEAPKPDRRAFEAVIAELNSDREETVYVGDDPERDIAGARAAGLAAVQVCYPGGPDPHPDATAIIQRDELRTLPAVLDEIVGDGANDA